MKRLGISRYYLDELLAEFSVLEAAVCGGMALLEVHEGTTSTIVSGIELQMLRVKDLIREIPACPEPNPEPSQE